MTHPEDISSTVEGHTPTPWESEAIKRYTIHPEATGSIKINAEWKRAAFKDGAQFGITWLASVLGSPELAHAVNSHAALIAERAALIRALREVLDAYVPGWDGAEHSDIGGSVMHARAALAAAQEGGGNG